MKKKFAFFAIFYFDASDDEDAPLKEMESADLAFDGIEF